MGILILNSFICCFWMPIINIILSMLLIYIKAYRLIAQMNGMEEHLSCSTLKPRNLNYLSSWLGPNIRILLLTYHLFDIDNLRHHKLTYLIEDDMNGKFFTSYSSLHLLTLSSCLGWIFRVVCLWGILFWSEDGLLSWGFWLVLDECLTVSFVFACRHDCFFFYLE